MEVNETWSQPVMFLVPQHHLERNGKKKYKKRSGSLKACREFIRDLGEIKDLLLLLRRCQADAKAWSPGPPHDASRSKNTCPNTHQRSHSGDTQQTKRMWHSKMAMRAHSASLEMSPGAAIARSESVGENGGWASGDAHCRITVLEGITGSPSPSADEDGGSVAAEEASAWKVTLKSSVLANSQIPNVDLRRSGTPGTNKIPTLSSVKGVIQDPEEPRLDAQHSDSEFREKVESGKQPADSGPGELLQECDSDALRQHSRAFLAADGSDSQRYLCSSQSTSTGDTSAAHVS
ncbi:Spermatogenesis-associated protein 31E1, partial [Manis javanica]